MKNKNLNLVRLVTVFSFLFLLNACVTTRGEYNEQRGVSAEAEEQNPTQEQSPVKSEDIKKGYDVEELRSEVAHLRGRVEELEHEKKSVDEAHAEEVKKLHAKIEDLEKQLKEKEDAAKGPKVPEGKSAFEAGKDAYFSGQFEAAIEYFDVYLKDHEKGKEVEEAYFTRGEANFRLKEFNKAIINYSKFPEKFQKSAFHPKALLRIAEAFEATGKKEDARAFYSDLVDKFPKTAEGKLAVKRLKKK